MSKIFCNAHMSTPVFSASRYLKMKKNGRMILFTLACSIKTHVLYQFYSSSSPCNLPVNLIKLINIQQSWSICLSQDGEYLAVLQDNMLEIRSRRDRYMLC